MFCSKCGRQLIYNVTFCPNCGAPVGGNNQVKPVKKQGFSKGQKITIIGLLSVIIVFLVVLILMPSNPSNQKKRTIMMYIVGSDLEAKGKIVTGELNAFDANKINTEENNILLYTGGTEKWHNFISNAENGIYLFDDTGFNKLQAQEKKNMGSPDTLSGFLNYAYENYPAQEYYLVIYDHGGALDGAVYDDFSKDNLKLNELSTALKNSPFNSNNKLSAVMFRTCLNGTIEVANIFEPYANYLVASEEVSWGQNPYSVLSFVNNIKSSDNELEIGKKFVDEYNHQMKKIDKFNSVTHTYSVIDLSKIKEVNKYLNEYIKSIDLVNNYNDIVRVRAGLYQYGNEYQEYNMVDLYSFVEKTSIYAKNDSKKLLNAINDAVLYNYTNNSSSHGISIYFPYSGADNVKKYFLQVYSNLSFSNNYKEFINDFYQLQNKPSGFAFNINQNEVNKDDEKNTISIQLSQEQISNYASATFTIFERDKEHPDYYRMIYNADDVELDSNGVLSSNYTNKILYVKDDDTNESIYAPSFYRKHNNTRFIYVTLYAKDKDFLDDDYMTGATLFFAPTIGENPVVGSAKLRSYNERIDGTLLDLNNYSKYEALFAAYKLLDNKGNVLPSEEWESAPVYTGWSADLTSTDDYKYSSLDIEGEYYALFIVNDIHDNSSYSKLIKVGD